MGTILVHTICNLQDGNDQVCKELYVCTQHQDCQYYQEQIIQIQQEQNTEVKREKFNTLR